jgi:predicted metal-dependent hydrolase
MVEPGAISSDVNNALSPDSEYRKEFELGVSEFNNGQFFECHDTFEHLWMDQRGERKRFVQGLIQVAVGIFHASRENFRGANSQLTKGMAKLAEFRPHTLGINVEKLYAELLPLHHAVQGILLNGEQGTVDKGLIPRIEYQYDAETMADF